eukprot:NODE_1146_length_1082_cov_434.426912_g884_i0.p1 GENE.NODE_1146_length_1082_cov_434.426912_g884_i0~~NODE_1146_length_1082_cov_434.426912_g884_i0.p1  ORF type:complete len:304 (-),score=70.79 NODE_1146_length_1082_cov_434.426912_g884_i0:88-999(-)
MVSYASKEEQHKFLQLVKQRSHKLQVRENVDPHVLGFGLRTSPNVVLYDREHPGHKSLKKFYYEFHHLTVMKGRIAARRRKASLKKAKKASAKAADKPKKGKTVSQLNKQKATVRKIDRENTARQAKKLKRCLKKGVKAPATKAELRAASKKARRVARKVELMAKIRKTGKARAERQKQGHRISERMISKVFIHPETDKKIAHKLNRIEKKKLEIKKFIDQYGEGKKKLTTTQAKKAIKRNVSFGSREVRRRIRIKGNRKNMKAIRREIFLKGFRKQRQKAKDAKAGKPKRKRTKKVAPPATA